MGPGRYSRETDGHFDEMVGLSVVEESFSAYCPHFWWILEFEDALQRCVGAEVAEKQDKNFLLAWDGSEPA